MELSQEQELHRKRIDYLIDHAWSYLSNLYAEKSDQGKSENPFDKVGRIYPFEVEKLNAIEDKINTYNIDLNEFQISSKLWVNGWSDLINKVYK